MVLCNKKHSNNKYSFLISLLFAYEKEGEIEKTDEMVA